VSESAAGGRNSCSTHARNNLFAQDTVLDGVIRRHVLDHARHDCLVALRRHLDEEQSVHRLERSNRKRWRAQTPWAAVARARACACSRAAAAAAAAAAARARRTSRPAPFSFAHVSPSFRFVNVSSKTLPVRRRPTDRLGRDSHPRHVGRRVTGSDSRVGCSPGTRSTIDAPKSRVKISYSRRAAGTHTSENLVDRTNGSSHTHSRIKYRYHPGQNSPDITKRGQARGAAHPGYHDSGACPQVRRSQ